jgi:hypothetical protein
MKSTRGGHNRVHYGYKRPETIKSLKKAIVGDSLERKRLLEKLIKLVREEERSE